MTTAPACYGGRRLRMGRAGGTRRAETVRLVEVRLLPCARRQRPRDGLAGPLPLGSRVRPGTRTLGVGSPPAVSSGHGPSLAPCGTDSIAAASSRG